MPRINFIPPPIDFNDRGSALVNPIMMNAQRLAETFTTEIPKIRMQQEAVAEDQRRYEGGVKYRADRDKIGDERYTADKERQADQDLLNQFGGYQTLMRPDGLDTTGDGVADVAGNVSSKGVTLPRFSVPKVASPAASASNDIRTRSLDDRERQFQQKQRESFIRDFIGQNVGTSMEPQFRSLDEGIAAWNKLNPAPEIEEPSGTYTDSPLGELEPSAEGGVTGDPTAAPGQTGGAPSMSMGAPVHTAMQRMLALQHLDRLRNIDPARRARNGLPNDMQIEQLKAQIEQQSQQPQAPQAQVPGESDPGMSMGTTEEAAPVEQPAAPAAPAARPITLSMRETAPTPSDLGGNDIAMAQWNAGTGQDLDPMVLKSLSNDISMSTLKMQQSDDPAIRARSGEIQKAYMLAASTNNVAGLVKLHTALAKLNLFQQVPVQTTNLRIQE